MTEQNIKNNRFQTQEPFRTLVKVSLQIDTTWFSQHAWCIADCRKVTQFFASFRRDFWSSHLRFLRFSRSTPNVHCHFVAIYFICVRFVSCFFSEHLKYRLLDCRISNTYVHISVSAHFKCGSCAFRRHFSFYSDIGLFVGYIYALC